MWSFVQLEGSMKARIIDFVQPEGNIKACIMTSRHAVISRVLWQMKKPLHSQTQLWTTRISVTKLFGKETEGCGFDWWSWSFCPEAKKQKVVDSIDEVGAFVQISMDQLRSSGNAHEKEIHDNVVSTIANFSLQIVVGISKVCAEHDNWNSSSDKLTSCAPWFELCTFERLYFLFATASDPAKATSFWMWTWKKLMTSFVTCI